MRTPLLRNTRHWYGPSTIYLTEVSQLLLQVPKGHCWVEGDNAEISLDSKSFGPVRTLTNTPFVELSFLCFCLCWQRDHGSFIDLAGNGYSSSVLPRSHCIWLLIRDPSLFILQIPLGLMKGKVTHVVWPPSRFGPVASHLPEGRVLSQKAGTRTYP